MKGFKPTGYGPTAGFKYPQSMGFTGSTGAYTNVSPYVRRKFANGGSVRGTDPGGSTINRKKTYAQWQTDTGSTSSLLPGYKDGGRTWIAGAIKKPGALHRALGVPQGEKIPAKKLAKAAHSDNPTMSRRANLAKTLKKMHKADGGYVEWVDRRYRVPRRYSNPTMSEGLRALPPLAKEMARSLTTGTRRAFGPKERRYGVSGQDLASNYSKGGKAKRMGYADGGATEAAKAEGEADKYMHSYWVGHGEHANRMLDRAKQYEARARGVRERSPKGHGPLARRPRSIEKGPIKERFYAKGGSVSPKEAKKIAERTVGEHVRYPAPKGHKGLEKAMR